MNVMVSIPGIYRINVKNFYKTQIHILSIDKYVLLTLLKMA